MSEPKRGTHDETCRMVAPKCLCLTCQNDRDGCCNKIHECGVEKCKSYIADEPTKKGASDV
mgnify:CR=1 FL=1